MKQVNHVESVSSQQILSVLSIVAGPITAIFTVLLQSSYSEYKMKKKELRGLSYELQANKGTLEGFIADSEEVGEIPFQLMDSSFKTFLSGGRLDDFPQEIRSEITSIYVNQKAIADASHKLEDKSVDKTVKTAIESSEILSDYLESYYESWGYDFYLSYLLKRTISWIRNTYGKIKFKIRNGNSESSLDFEYLKNHSRVQIPELKFTEDNS